MKKSVLFVILLCITILFSNRSFFYAAEDGSPDPAPLEIVSEGADTEQDPVPEAEDTDPEEPAGELSSTDSSEITEETQNEPEEEKVPEESPAIQTIPISNVLLKYSAYTFSDQERNLDVTTKVTAVVDGAETVLVQNQDYITSYENNVNAGTATMIVTGIGRFTGTIRKDFRIDPRPIKQVNLEHLSMRYTGTPRTQTYNTVVRAWINDNWKVLTLNQDYTISYENNVNVGTMIMTVTGIGNYYGTIIKQIPIKPVTIQSVTLKYDSLAYTGRPRTQDNPTIVQAAVGGVVKTLTKDVDYRITYENNKNVGIATLIVTGIGNYAGTIKENFKVVPKGTSLTSITAESGGFLVRWNKMNIQTTGYQLQYSLDPSFSTGTKRVTIAHPETERKRILGLEAGKTYYVRIRPYKLDENKNYFYAAWSKALSVVPETVPVQSIALPGLPKGIALGQSAKLTVDFTPVNTTDKGVKWKSSNTAVASIDPDGVVTAKKTGTVTITATSGKVSAVCKIRVNMPGMLTIIDDDGKTAFTKKMMPIIREKGISISTAIIPERIEDTTGTWKGYMTWKQIANCAAGGAEILCHTYHHYATAPLKEMTDSEMIADFQLGKDTLIQHGYASSADIVVYPGSTANYDRSRQNAAEVFKMGIHCNGNVNNQAGDDLYYLQRYGNVASSYDLEGLKKLIDDTIESGGWMIWNTHCYYESFGDEQLANLSAAIDYALEKGLPIVSASEGYGRFTSY